MKTLKDNKKIYIVFSTVAFLAACLIFYNWMFNFTSIINRNIKSASTTDNSLYLSEVTPFKWDKAFIITPYTGGDTLDKIVGVRCNLKPTDTELIRRIVFIKDKTFVYDYLCNITDIDFTPIGMVVDKNHCKFTIEKRNSNRLLLKYSE